MNFPRRDRRLFLLLAVVGLAMPVVARLAGGSWSQAGVWLPLVAIGLAGVQFGRPWRRPVTRKQLDDYQRWRAETELTEEEQAVPLSGRLGASLEVTEPTRREPQPRLSYDDRRREFAASVGRGFFVKGAIGFTLATLVCLSVLPYAIVRGNYTAGIVGVLLLLVAPLFGYIAFTSWWYLRRGEFYEPPPLLTRVSQAAISGLNSNIGRQRDSRR